MAGDGGLIVIGGLNAALKAWSESQARRTARPSLLTMPCRNNIISCVVGIHVCQWQRRPAVTFPRSAQNVVSKKGVASFTDQKNGPTTRRTLIAQITVKNDVTFVAKMTVAGVRGFDAHGADKWKATLIWTSALAPSSHVSAVCLQ